MSEASRREVRAGLEPSLARLWRYALVLSRARDVAEDLVQATCLRAIERADQKGGSMAIRNSAVDLAQ
jgi:RNA polymerase sigma-70 factor (ECF subfamily)